MVYATGKSSLDADTLYAESLSVQYTEIIINKMHVDL